MVIPKSIFLFQVYLHSVSAMNSRKDFLELSKAGQGKVKIL